MLTLLVASDTHGDYARLLEAVKRAKPDMLLFLGDGLRDVRALDVAFPVRAVKGNCDWLGDEPLSRVEEIGGYRIFMTHGHREGVKYQLDAAIAAAAEREADVLLFGHTHCPLERTLPAGSKIEGTDTVLFKQLLVVCPGSLGQPRSGMPSFATLTLSPQGVLAGFGNL